MLRTIANFRRFVRTDTIPCLLHLLNYFQDEKNGGYSFDDFVHAGIPSTALEQSNLCQYYGIKQTQVNNYPLNRGWPAIFTRVSKL